MEEYWDPDEVLANCATERTVRGMNHVQLASERLNENVDLAVSRLVHIIKYTHNEKLAFDSCKYLIERVLGRSPDYGETATNDDLVDLVYSMAATSNQDI